MRGFSKVTLVQHPEDLNQKTFHMRRCHLCDALNVHPVVVNHCGKCQKPIAPFFYYDEGALRVDAENPRPHYHPSPPTEYGPLIGISILWSE